MVVNPDEISKVIKQQIKSYSSSMISPRLVLLFK